MRENRCREENMRMMRVVLALLFVVSCIPAAFAAYNTTFEPDGEDRSISYKPDALVLVNPAFGFPDRNRLTPEQAEAARGPIGAFITSWKVTAGGPPAILFFGTEDPLQEKA